MCCEFYNCYFREEIKWLLVVAAIIVSTVSSILYNRFTVAKDVNLTIYRVEQIEADRASKWARYEDCCEERDELLKLIGEDIAVIKTKLEAMNLKME